MKTTNNKVIAIIPARYGSTRFPGKPLFKIAGKTLIQRTVENTLRCTKLNKVIVATDDVRIFNHVKSFYDNVVMTSEFCLNGTERVFEAIKNSSESMYDNSIVLNIQGDEPCVEIKTIGSIIDCLENSSAYMSTGVSILSDHADIKNPSVVKCVINKNHEALYFSRAPIPYPHKDNTAQNYYKHIGIYAFRYHFLKKYLTLKNSDLQITEDLEQLKVLEHGYKIKVAIVSDNGMGIDTPHDAQKLDEIITSQKNI